MTVATEQGKEHALKELGERRKRNAKEKRINNSTLVAGSNMYYYCKSCGKEQSLSELHTPDEIKEFCDECKALKDLGWLKE